MIARWFHRADANTGRGAPSTAAMPTLLCDPRDRATVLLTAAPAVVWALAPNALGIGVSVWWLGNTAAHHAVHRRIFRARAANVVFGLWLTAWLGVPQEAWRQRHLAHHAGRARGLRWNGRLAAELALLLTAWTAAALLAPAFLVGCWAPGLVLGLLLAAVHGHFEHRGGVTDVHARWWNVLTCNDGYHTAHHAAPARHFTELPAITPRGTRTSALPPPLRWLRRARALPRALDGVPAALLDRAERLVLRWPWLRARVLAAHRGALAAVLAGEAAPRSIVIVGGGLFPRSALLLRELYPAAAITVLDAEPSHLAAAERLLPAGVRTCVGRFEPGRPFAGELAADLAVVPLALRGDRARVCELPPCPRVLVHDWLWHRRGAGRVVAWWLGKRVYVVRQRDASALRRPA